MFDNHFEVYLADTEESKNIHYSIRYQVYCEEMGYENSEDHPLEMESDDDDAKSIHFIVRNKSSNQWVGAMRLIYKLDGVLPIEKACLFDDNAKTGQVESIEISRLCVIKEARTGNPPQGDVEDLSKIRASNKVKVLPIQKKLNQLITWGLFYAAAEYGYKNDINYYYFMTSAILAKLMRRGGLVLSGIGQPCEHRGLRYPFKIDAFKTFKSDMWSSGFSSYRLYSEKEMAFVA